MQEDCAGDPPIRRSVCSFRAGSGGADLPDQDDPGGTEDDSDGTYLVPYVVSVFDLVFISDHAASEKVLRVLPVWGVAAVMAVIFLGSSVAPFLNKVLDVNSIPVLPDGGVYFLYYLCGYFFAVREVGVDKGRNVWLTAAVAVLALGMILSRTLAGFSIQMAYNYPFTVLLAVLLFAAGWNGSIKKHRIPWQEAGALSFAVYLVHPVYVNLLYKFVKITPFTVLEQCGVQSVAAGQAVLILLLAAFCLVVLALATATAWVLRKIPVLRKFVL